MQPLQVLRLTVQAGLSRKVLYSGLSKNVTFRSFHFSNKLNMPIQVGSSIPNVDLYETSPANKVNTHDLCKDKTIVIFGVPGAFTPGCSKTHLPGYVKDADAIKAKGIDEIVCVSVNDAFVMDAWAKANNTEGKLRLLADPSGEFTKQMGLDQNLPPLGGLRSKRFSAVVEKCVIKTLNVEPDGTGLSCSLSSNLKI